MKDTFCTIARFQYSTEAQIIKGKLEAEGVKVFLADHLTIDTDPLVSNAIGGVKLKVWAEDKERAIKILDSISAYSLDDEGQEIECPICGSSKVELYTRVRSLKSLFAFLFSLLTTALPIHSRHKYHCENCKQEFNLE